MTLKEARKAKGLTLEVLATVCKTSKAQLSHIENGTRNPSAELLAKLIAVLGEFEINEKCAKFTRADTCKTIGEIYGYLHKKSPESSTPKELAFAAEHPFEGFLKLHRKLFLHLQPRCEKWIADKLKSINVADIENAEKPTNTAEQTAFLIGYYQGIKSN